jgi:hypothetical protein
VYALALQQTRSGGNNRVLDDSRLSVLLATREAPHSRQGPLDIRFRLMGWPNGGMVAPGTSQMLAGELYWDMSELGP